MVRANALIIVIIISLAIGIFSSSLIFLAYHSRLHASKNLLLNKLELNLQSGVNILLSGYDTLPYNQNVYLDLYDNEEDSLMIKKLRWGLFEVAVLNSFSGKSNTCRTLEYGYKFDSISSSAIYIIDEKRPLNVGGETSIRGTAYVSRHGVQKDFTHGQYKGNTLIYGKIKTSNDTLPGLNKRIVKYLLDFFNEKSFLKSSYTISSKISSDSLTNSYLNQTLLEYHTSAINITERKYSGNIIIYSDSSVTISSKAQLNNVIIFAPKIRVEDGFQGNVQLFASDSIIIGRNAKLTYPSAVGLFKSSFRINTPTIVIEEDAFVSGIIFTHQSLKDMYETMILLKKNSLIEGQIYGDGFVEHKGKVLGNITCKRFRLSSPDGIYDNLLLNAVIDNTNMYKYFVGSSIISSKKEKAIVRWLE